MKEKKKKLNIEKGKKDTKKWLSIVFQAVVSRYFFLCVMKCLTDLGNTEEEVKQARKETGHY